MKSCGIFALGLLVSQLCTHTTVGAEAIPVHGGQSIRVVAQKWAQQQKQTETHGGHEQEKEKRKDDRDHQGHADEGAHGKENDTKPQSDGQKASEKEPHGDDDKHPREVTGTASGGDAHGGHEESQILRLTLEQVKLAGISSVEVTPGRLDLSVRLAGEIQLNEDRMVQVVPRISGVVASVSSHLGDRVTKGTVMAVIDSRELADAKSTYIAARERAKLAETKAEREERLLSKQISSEQEYLDAKLNLSEAQIAELVSAQKLIALGLSPAVVKGISNSADESLTRFEIVSPIDGTVIEKNVSVGTSVSESDAIFKTADLGSVWVIASVYEKDIGKIKSGALASIEAKAYPGQAFEGAITWVSDTVDERTRTVKVRAELDNSDGLLKPGMFVRARVVTDAKENVLTVPPAAIRRQGGETVVFVDKGDGGYERRDVELGAQTADRIEILKGVTAGERVVSAGAFILKSEIEKEGFGAGHAH